MSLPLASTSGRLGYRPMELARLLGVSTRTIKRRIARGELHCPNGFIPATEVDRLLHGNPREGPTTVSISPWTRKVLRKLGAG